MSIQTREMLRLRDCINRLLARHTGQTVRRISRDTDRDFYMSAEEAVSYGLCDRILDARPVTGSSAANQTK